MIRVREVPGIGEGRDCFESRQVLVLLAGAAPITHVMKGAAFSHLMEEPAGCARQEFPKSGLSKEYFI